MRSFLSPRHAGERKDDIVEILTVVNGGGEFRGAFKDFYAACALNHNDNRLCTIRRVFAPKTSQAYI